MRIINAKFVTSVADPKQIKDFGIKEIAIAGRSNVGKSSFINFLTNNKNLAKTSSTPGRTRLLNYFNINNELILVDLPGYGYAKVGGDDKDNWDKLIGGYLQNSQNLVAVAILVDIRHEPTPLDLQMVAFAHHYQIPFFIVATKADKLSKAQIQKQKQVLATGLKLGVENIVVTSALKKMGLSEVLQQFDKFLAN
ncbi:MAG: YihA family ribosome biogenesis GTP-binding protein [Clostridiales bacterium]|nr:YihA family ribosome biogenesis GTP-binding protein [Clostridiales bacterium]